MDLKDPNTLNLYQYVKGSPLKYVDYSGHESIGEPKSYLERTLDMVILGSYTDEFTWTGLVLQFLLGLTGIDVACDIRDFTADITVNRDMTSLSWYGMMALDAVALFPLIGGVKYLDDLAYGVKMLFKNGDELIDGGKRIARAADALHDLSKKGRTVLNDMADTLRGMAKKVVKNADMLNDAKYIDDAANVASDAGKKLDDVIGGGSDALNEVKRIDKIEVEFNYNSKYDEAEFARQLADQEKGMNELTVQEYLDNRQKYIEQGRAIESNAAQQAAREKAYVNKVNELQNTGLSIDEAEEQAQKWLNTQAALHNPDQVAGGYASNVGGVGDKGVNSSIGSQWRYRIDAVDEQIQKMAEDMSEAERNSTYLNVNLIYGGD